MTQQPAGPKEVGCLRDVEAPSTPVQAGQVLPRGRLTDAELECGSRDRAGRDVGPQNLELAVNAGYLFAGDAMDAFEVNRNGESDRNIFRTTARARYMF